MSLAHVYKTEFVPLTLKRLLLDLDISQGVVATACKVSRPTINLAINRGYIPARFPSLRTDIETFLASPDLARHVNVWLAQNGIGDARYLATIRR